MRMVRVLLVGAFAPLLWGPAVLAQPQGDISGDGAITGADATALINDFLGVNPLRGDPAERADCNQDGRRDAADLVLIVTAAQPTQEVTVGAGGGEVVSDNAGVIIPADLLTGPTQVTVHVEAGSPAIGDHDTGATVTITIPLSSINLSRLRALAEAQRQAEATHRLGIRDLQAFSAMSIVSPLFSVGPADYYLQSVKYKVEAGLFAFHAVLDSTVQGDRVVGTVTAVALEAMVAGATTAGDSALRLTVTLLKGSNAAAQQSMTFTDGGPSGGVWREHPISPSQLTRRRDVVVLVHGVLTDSAKTWGSFTEALSQDPAVDTDNLAIWRVSYNFWSSMHDNGTALANLMAQADNGTVQNYYFAGHSMGTQVIRQAFEQAPGLGHSWQNKVCRVVHLAGMHDGTSLEVAGDILLTWLATSSDGGALIAGPLVLASNSPGFLDLAADRPADLGDLPGTDVYLIASDGRSKITDFLWQAMPGNPANDGWVPYAGAVDSADFAGVPEGRKMRWTGVPISFLGDHVALWPNPAPGHGAETRQSERYIALRNFLLPLSGFQPPPPAMVSVPAGTFRMGDPWNQGATVERPAHDVYLSAYEMGQYEVTNAQYAAFLNAALGAGEITVTDDVVYLTGNSADALFYPYPAEPHSQIIYIGGTFTPRTRTSSTLGEVYMADHPVVAVTWYGAAAYCNWLSRQQGFQEVYTESGTWPSDLTRNGYHLPTEAQWKRAAGWDPAHNDPVAQGHWRYGFMSDLININRANYSDYSSGFANPLSLTSYPYTSPVGFYNGATTSRTGPTVNSPSAAGCYDMSGNVWEWCNDWWRRVYTEDPVSDPVGPSNGLYRLMRGGSWSGYDSYCRSAFRNGDVPLNRFDHVGFRVSRTP